MIIIDLRQVENYQKGHLSHAINVPTPSPPLSMRDLINLENDLLYVLKNVPVFTLIGVYCKKGIRAGIAHEILVNNGFYNVVNLGGLEIDCD